MNNIKRIEDYMAGRLLPGDKLLFDADRILNAETEHNVLAQRHTYTLIEKYGRKKLKAEIEAVHQQLFTNKKYRNFAQRVLRLFS
ncbi:hypothetical protein DJ568_00945 [Mucilaginibacter hurinus]|uniref:Uncharacterized protein n=1 Tax=Mucilaginibacter hurinus TaxID=2201324 RepID=A0A367GTE2_9SPHI|nr:hypothetical protein DJ568_00945 [Mucilaginibacter hurinus]